MGLLARLGSQAHSGSDHCNLGDLVLELPRSLGIIALILSLTDEEIGTQRGRATYSRLYSK